VTVKDLLRPLPGMRQVTRIRQQFSFNSSAHYWEQNYARGGTSGGGSCGTLARAKADFLNAFVEEHHIQSVVEFGCGDGNQLSLAEYPNYVGLDVSRTAISLCKQRFAEDMNKSFFLYDGEYFVDRGGCFEADLGISLDVVYHLVEDSVYETYMRNLFAAARLYAIIYSSNFDVGHTAAHVRHRKFTTWIDHSCPEWQLSQQITGPNSQTGVDFFVFTRVLPSSQARRVSDAVGEGTAWRR
jgi:SAM-dependent methyltransferase